MYDFLLGYKLFFVVPIWVTVLFLDFFCIDILYMGREKTEGFPYNISWSSQYGDRALIIGILIGVSILKKIGIAPPFNGYYPIICLIVSMLTGAVLYIIAFNNPKNKPYTAMDQYHNAIIVPILVYSLLLFVPFIYKFGTTIERAISFSMLFIWFLSFLYDLRDGRLQQRPWIMANGFGAILKK